MQIDPNPFLTLQEPSLVAQFRMYLLGTAPSVVDKALHPGQDRTNRSAVTFGTESNVIGPISGLDGVITL